MNNQIVLPMDQEVHKCTVLLSSLHAHLLVSVDLRFTVSSLAARQKTSIRIYRYTTQHRVDFVASIRDRNLFGGESQSKKQWCI